MVGGQGHVLRFAFDQDAAAQTRRDAQRAALDLVHERHVELSLADEPQKRVRGDVHTERRLAAGRVLALPQPSQPARYGPARRGTDPQMGAARGECAGRPGLRDEGAHAVHERAGAVEDDAAQGVARHPVRSRAKSAPPSVSSIRLSWVDRDGWVMPSRRAALCRLPVSSMAHSARRCLTSSSMGIERKAVAEVAPDVQMRTETGELGG